MQTENLKNRPVIIIGLAIVFLILLSLIPGDIKFGPFQVKPVDLFMDVKPDSLLSQISGDKESGFAASIIPVCRKCSNLTSLSNL